MIQQLNDLDRASPQFHEQFANFLRGDDYRDSLAKLQSDGLAWFVEYLDGVLAGISDHASDQFQESLHELRKICGIKEVLPTSCTLPESLVGCVYEGTFNNSKVRIRRVRTYPGGDPRKAKEAFHQVAVISKHMAHPNIVSLLGVITESLELVSNCGPAGDLLEHINMSPNVDRLSLLSDVAEGLNYLHSCGVVHGDLKGSNILIDMTGRARITDFGLAMVTQDLGSIRGASAGHGNTTRWIASEILDGLGTYSKAADVFSFAGVVIEAFTGATPFGTKPSNASILAITSGERPPRPTHPAFVDGLWALTQQCWGKEPHLRPTISTVRCHFHIPAWKRLINRPLSIDDRIPLITAIFSDNEEAEAVKHLSGNDAQTFVDVIDETLGALDPWLRRKCLSTLCRVCGHQSLLPRSVQIPPCYNRMDPPLCHGGYAEVWKGEYQGREVAVKVLKVYLTSDLDKITHKFCKEVMTWKTLCHRNVLPLLGVTMGNTQFAMASEWMANGNINEFLEAKRDDSHLMLTGRFELLEDVARGLLYIHEEGMIHGDLKGANILIDQQGRACLADFGLMTIVSDSVTSATSNSYMGAGTTRWMSPELLDPENLGFEDSRPTKPSDCYALGMVILEVLSDKPPFAGYNNFVVMQKVIRGEHPKIPGSDGEFWAAVRFADGGLRRTLEQCWSLQPMDRPAVKDVLACLEQIVISLNEPLELCSSDCIETLPMEYASSRSVSPALDRRIITHALPTGTESGEPSPQNTISVPTSTWEVEDWLGYPVQGSKEAPQQALDLDLDLNEIPGSLSCDSVDDSWNSGQFEFPDYQVPHGQYEPHDSTDANPPETSDHHPGSVQEPMDYSSQSPHDIDPHLPSRHIDHLAPPVSPTGENVRGQVKVPQRTYIPLHQQDYMDQFIPESPITFHRQLGGSGIELTEVLDDNLDDLVGRNDPMFSNYTGLSISLRLEWPGYKSWTKQVNTKDWRREPKLITRAKLARQVTKLVQDFIRNNKSEPVTDGFEMWKVGPGFIQARDLVLVGLTQVAKSSWQAELQVSVDHGEGVGKRHLQESHTAVPGGGWAIS